MQCCAAQQHQHMLEMTGKCWHPRRQVAVGARLPASAGKKQGPQRSPSQTEAAEAAVGRRAP